jgi:hypothetical protein
MSTRSPTAHPCSFGTRTSDHRGSAPSTENVTNSGCGEDPSREISVTLPARSSFFSCTQYLPKVLFSTVRYAPTSPNSRQPGSNGHFRQEVRPHDIARNRGSRVQIKRQSVLLSQRGEHVSSIDSMDEKLGSHKEREMISFCNDRC